MRPEPIAVTLAVVDVLESLDVSYLVGGSLARAVQGVSRATMDADIVAELRLENAEPSVRRLGEQLSAPPERRQNASLLA